MSKVEKPTAKKRGPYLTAAFFCEQTIEDMRDKAMSAIRMYDKTTIILDTAVAPPDLPSENKRLPVSLIGLVSFKTGDSPGEHTIRIGLVSPSGKTNPNVFERTFVFGDAPYSGVNVRLETTILVKQGGLFHMEVYLDGELRTRVPFEIEVQKVARLQSAAAQGD